MSPFAASHWIYERSKGKKTVISVRVPAALRETIGYGVIDHAFDPDDAADRELTWAVAQDLRDELFAEAGLVSLAAATGSAFTAARQKLGMSPREVGLLARLGAPNAFAEYVQPGAVVPRRDLLPIALALSLDPEADLGWRLADLGVVTTIEHEAKFNAPSPVWLLNRAWDSPRATEVLAREIARAEPLLHRGKIRPEVWRDWNGFVQAGGRVLQEIRTGEYGFTATIPTHVDPRIAWFVKPLVARGYGEAPSNVRELCVAAKKAFRMAKDDLFALNEALKVASAMGRAA